MGRYRKKRKPPLPRRIVCQLDGPTFELLRKAAADRVALTRAAGRAVDVTLEDQARRALTGALRFQVAPEPPAHGPRRRLVLYRPAPELVEGLLASAERHGLATAEASGRLIGGYLRMLGQILDSPEPSRMEPG